MARHSMEQTFRRQIALNYKRGVLGLGRGCVVCLPNLASNPQKTFGFPSIAFYTTFASKYIQLFRRDKRSIYLPYDTDVAVAR